MQFSDDFTTATTYKVSENENKIMHKVLKQTEEILKFSAEIPESTQIICKSNQNQSSNHVETTRSMAISIEEVPQGQIHSNKGNYCFYCSKRVTKICRHLEKSHPKEIKVIEFTALPKLSSERRVMLEKLRKEGNFIHNTTVLRAGTGNLLPDKRTQQPTNKESYVPCLHCKSFFKKRLFWMHEKKCKLKDVDQQKKSRRVILSS